MDPVATLHRTGSPFVGRVDELLQLTDLVGLHSDGGRAGAVVVSGDAGVGKTRLLAALRDRGEAAGQRVLVGHCVGLAEGVLPYLPFREALGQLMRESPTLSEALTTAHTGVGRLLPQRSPVPKSRSGSVDVVERGDVFVAVHALLEDLAKAQPVVLIVEDVHWADPSTRELLTYLFTRRFARPVSIVASYRSDDLYRRHPLRATAAEWARLPGLERIHLRPLRDADVRSLVAQLRDGPLRERDLQAIVERAEGNPFYAEELVVAAEHGGPSLPGTLADLLLVRLDFLDSDTRRLVRAASVAGRRVGHDLLADVVELDAAALDSAVRNAVEANVLVTDGSNGYAFRHALLSEAVYDDLLPGERVRLHARYTSALRRSNTSGAAAELARHARSAHDTKTALYASIQAGEEAMAVGGPDEAARHYEVALELLSDVEPPPTGGTDAEGSAHGDGDPVDRVELAARAGEALVAAGRPERSVALMQDMLDQLPEDASVSDRGRLLYGLAAASLLLDGVVDALEVTAEALAVLAAEPATALRAEVLSLHALANAFRQRNEDAVRWATEALQLAQQLKLADVVASATTTLARLEQRAGDPTSSIKALLGIVTQARESGDVAAELRGLHHIAGIHYEIGEQDEALALYSTAMDRAAQIGRPWAPYGLDARVLAGITAYVKGDWPRARECVDVTGQSPPATAEAILAAVGLQIAASSGDSSSLKVVAQVRAWWERDGLIAVLAGAAAIDLYGDRGDVATARATYADVVTTLARIWQGPFLARVRLSALMLGQLARAASTEPAARRADLSREASDLVAAAANAVAVSERQNRPVGIEGQAWMSRVTAEHQRLDWLVGGEPDYESLVDAWERTVDDFQQFGHAFEVARSQARLAAVLRAGGQASKARTVIDAARATATRLGAAPLLVELRELGSTSTDRPRSSRRDEPLTPREEEILALVAQGRSNADIGRQLFISAKTVSVHVSNVLAKLGASGRTEAAALARSRGLLPR
jgi:DNA-binding CsgD family transcriptional regulator/tetratricopeptide (TPR) repeat protein